MLFKNHFSWKQLVIFLLIWGGHTAFILADYHRPSFNSTHHENVIKIAKTAILGPLCGAACRDWHPSFMGPPLILLYIFGTLFLLSALAQVIPWPSGESHLRVRLLIWTLGVAGWFIGGMLSVLCVFS